MNPLKKNIVIVAGFLLPMFAFGQSLEITPDKTLSYNYYENGDRIPDFSFCGYMASEEAIPDVTIKVRVPWMQGDATERIQRAIDYVSSLPVGKDGFRGAILLDKGLYNIESSLKISESGVVLRGSGCGEDETVLVGSGVDRATLIRIVGVNDKVFEDSVAVANQYVPVNAVIIPLPENHGFKVGDKIVITRPSTKEWISTLGTDKIGLYVDYQLTFWGEGDFNLNWERMITASDAKSITIDVPITNSLDPQFGGGLVSKYKWKGRINHVGIENLRCLSDYDAENIKDENHRWMAITIENAEDGWIRRVIGEHFVSSTVAVWESAKRFTVEDCKNLSPIGEIGGYRRYAFQTLGQQTLFQRCYAEYGYHDFSVGFSVAGPNAFVQCYSYKPYSFSGALGGWSCGTLFDKVSVHGEALKVTWRDVDGQGGGWSGANSLFWQCRTPQLHIVTPPTAHNWAFGTWGQGYGNGSHEMWGQFLKPESFYYAQLEARLGQKSAETDKIMLLEPNTFGETNPAYTAIMSNRAKKPELTMDKWIDEMISRYPISVSSNDIASIDDIRPAKSIKSKPIDLKPIYIKNGVLTYDDRIVTGQISRTSLWRGSTRPSLVRSASPHLSRFVPGREGRGLTDNLDTIASDMLHNGKIAINHYPALWYERRRDDHGRSMRVDADVWAPFYEQPFSRSGEGEASDRLSKYDLNKYNTWYWMRIKQFADLADRNGLLLIQDHYLQHNIIEEGAHWADYPWRSANNINELGFPENTYFADDKRVFMAEQFYDLSNVKLTNYHRQYIRKYLDELAGNINTIHHLGAEYTGPVHFVKFWLDVIEEWEKETGHDVKIMLPGTKDMQDSILTDVKYNKFVDIIDICQWHYRADSSLYAPQGGVSLTARQYARIMNVGEESFDGIYRAVSEYRTAYPDKAIVYTYGRFPQKDWASFVAGGSLCKIPKIKNLNFYNDAAKMYPKKNVTAESKYWGMGKNTVGYIIYAKNKQITLDLTDDKTNYLVQRINPVKGTFIGKSDKVKGGQVITLNSNSDGDVVIWLSRHI